MAGIFYNPADDGLPAKAWECLRRNPPFASRARRAATLAVKYDPKDHGMTAAMYLDSWIHNIRSPLAAMALSHLIIFNEGGMPQGALFSLATSWRDTPAPFRNAFSANFEKARTVQAIKAPPRGIEGRPSKMTEWIFCVREQCRAGDKLVVIPRIRTPEDRNKAIAALTALVPAPVLAFNPDSIQASGLLGAKAQWAAFLHYEGLRHNGASEVHATDLVSLLLFGKATYGLMPESKWLQAKSSWPIQVRTEAKAIIQTRGSLARDRIGAVKQAIRDIYPG